MVSYRSLMFGFLVLGFAIFVAGFLVGMLAIAVLDLPAGTTDAGLMFLILGFITGMLTIAIALSTVRVYQTEKTS